MSGIDEPCEDWFGNGDVAVSDGFRHVSRRDYAAGESGRGPSVPYAGANNPRAGQWDGRRMSRSMVADYKPFVVTDGEGMRCSIYVSGCSFACLHCFNESIWDYRAGRPYDDDLEERIMRDLSIRQVAGLTLLGGEPFLNTPMLLRLCHRVREEFGHDKTIWSWTGYAFEELMRPGETPDKRALLDYVDVLVDGRFVDALKDPSLQFRGSGNQRILDMPASLAAGRPVPWSRLHDGAPVRYMHGDDRTAAEGGD
jgi:anaerobic ribonucleoside-triphosphate reductase activating protein